MRRLVSFIVVVLLLATSYAANACSRIGPPPSDEEMFAKASAVFIGHVYRVEAAGTTRLLAERAMERLEKRELSLAAAEEAAMRARIESEPPVLLVEASLRVVEVLKGRPPADGKVRSLPIVMCSGALVVGADYLFFLGRDNFVFIDPDLGTRPFRNWAHADDDREVQRENVLLEKLQPAEPQE